MRGAFRSPLLCALMVAGAVLAAMLKPTVLLAEQKADIDLERMVPRRMDNWRMVPLVSGQIVDPGQRELIQTIYTQNLVRTYMDKDGYLIMLSIAYGKDQRDALQLHRPDICYPAQGFSLLEKHGAELAGIPLTRMQTQLGSRYEPVTYWTVIGDRPYVGSLAKKMIEMRYGFAGTIPDGMLVRISSMDRDTETAYKKQEDFALAMIEALPADVRPRFAGQ